MINETESMIREAAEVREVGRVLTIPRWAQSLSHVIGWIISVLPSILKEDTIPHLADEEPLQIGLRNMPTITELYGGKARI